MNKIKVIGLQRSGTTYLEYVIQRNFKCDITKEGDRSVCWKHALPLEPVKLPSGSETGITIERIQEEDVFTVLVTKPFDKWVQSLQKYPADIFHKRPELKNDKNWRVGKNMNMKALQKFYHDFHVSWIKELDSRGMPYLDIDYIDLLKSPETELDRLLKVGFEKKLKKYSTEMKVPQSKDFDKKRRDHYLK